MGNLFIFAFLLTLLSFSFKCSVILKILPTDMVEMKTDSLNLTLPTFFEMVKLNTDYITLNNSTSNQLSFQGYGVFINISYSTVFLKLSLDQSLIYLSLNNQNKINYNLSQYKFNFYNVNDDNCWLYVEQNQEYCASSFHFKNNNFRTLGYLGHDFGFFEKKFVMLQNLVYLMQGISTYTNEKNDNAHGILGLGYSENEGVYGNSLMEELIERGVVYKHQYSLCINKADSFLIIGDDEGVKENLGKIQWFDQFNTFNFMIKLDAIKMNDRKLNRDILNAHLNLDNAAIYLPEQIVEPIVRNIVNNLCYIYREESSVFYKLKEKICKNIKDLFYGDTIMINLTELNLLMHFLPDIFLSLYDESFKKSFTKKISNYFKICPSQNKTELLEKLSNNSNVFEICSMVLINYKSKVDVELGTFFFENLYTSFDLQNGKIGFVDTNNCSELKKNLPETDGSFWLEILYNFLLFIGVFFLILISINKCDNYFHDDYEIVIEEEEEEEEEQRNQSQMDN